MKKRTDEEKLQMVNDACDLLNDGIEKIRQAEKLLHLCGIDICSYVDIKEVPNWNASGSNIQIYSGLPKMERIIGIESYHPNDCFTEKPDRSRKKLIYRGLIFLQLATQSESKFVFK